MGILSKIERGVGKRVEAVFQFKKKFDPVELDWMVRKKVEGGKKKLLEKTYAPNDIEIFISEHDWAEYKSLSDQIKGQIRGSLLAMFEDKNYEAIGDIEINISAKKELKKGQVEIEAKIVEGKPLRSEDLGRLEIFENERKLGEVRLKYKDKYLIGRNKNCDVVIDDETVSKKHAEILKRLDKIIIKDLSSKNGVKVNGKKVEDALLKDGDRVDLGNARIIWYRK